MTLDQLNELAKKITLSTPFGFSDSELTVPSEFGPKYATPVSNGGSPMSRHDMNGLGFLATIGTFLDSIGYQYPYNAYMAQRNGYPMGAVVSYIDNNWRLRQFVNTRENNPLPTEEFDEVLNDTSMIRNGWKPLYEINNYNFFPDYSSRTLVREISIMPPLPATRIPVTISEPGWILIERTIDNWDDANEAYGSLSPAEREKFSVANYVSLSAHAGTPTDAVNFNVYDLFTMTYSEGRVASRLIPSNGGVYITGKCALPVTSMTVRIYRFDMEAS